MQQSTDEKFDNSFHSNNENNKRKRRSKNDQDGRTAKCVHCDKTYLSDIALNNHIKTKHAHLVEIIARGRGRPRKNLNESTSEVVAFEVKYRDFFENINRKRDNEEDFDLMKAAKEDFDNIYTKYNDILFKNVKSVDEFPLFGTIKEKTCDLAFWKYIEFAHSKASRDYFDFVFKFIVLFRECINLKREKEDSHYSENQTAEIIPDSCNDFVSDFMEKQDYFGLEINELIEIIQHFCHWLWENGHTTSRLSLINN